MSTFLWFTMVLLIVIPGPLLLAIGSLMCLDVYNIDKTIGNITSSTCMSECLIEYTFMEDKSLYFGRMFLTVSEVNDNALLKGGSEVQVWFMKDAPGINSIFRSDIIDHEKLSKSYILLGVGAGYIVLCGFLILLAKACVMFTTSLMTTPQQIIQEQEQDTKYKVHVIESDAVSNTIGVSDDRVVVHVQNPSVLSGVAPPGDAKPYP